MYEISLWELKLVPTIFVFAITIKILKNNQKGFYFTKKPPFTLKVFKFLYFPLPLYLIWSKAYCEPWNKLGFSNLANHGFEPRPFGAWVEAMVEWLRSWISNQQWFQDRLSFHSFEVDEMSTRYSWGPQWKKAHCFLVVPLYSWDS